MKWPPEDDSRDGSECEDSAAEEVRADGEPDDVPHEFVQLVANSTLVPAICSYLRNDSGTIKISITPSNGFKLY